MQELVKADAGIGCHPLKTLKEKLPKVDVFIQNSMSICFEIVFWCEHEAIGLMVLLVVEGQHQPDCVQTKPPFYSKYKQ